MHVIIVHQSGVITLDPKVGNELWFFNHRVECPSCHDVYDKQVKAKKASNKIFCWLCALHALPSQVIVRFTVSKIREEGEEKEVTGG